MKWITHQAGAMAAALALNMPPVGLAAACFGALLPDIIDQRLARLAPTPRGRQRVFNRIHRGATHWFGWWVALFLGALLVPAELVSGLLSGMAPGMASGFVSDLLTPAGLAVLSGVGFGGLTHILLDMLTPQGVPLQPFSRKNRFSLSLCATGSIGEYCFLAVLVAGVWLFAGENVVQLVRDVSKGALF